jgi:hypothetical protein
LDESFHVADMHVEVEKNVIRVGFERADQEPEARRVAAVLTDSCGFKHGVKPVLMIDRTWRPSADGHRVYAVLVSVAMAAGASMTVTGIVTDAQGNAVVMPAAHPRTFKGCDMLAFAALADPSLSRALHFFTKEVIDDDRPLYGIYKALEELAAQLTSTSGGDGWTALARLVGRPKSFVEDVKETTQLTRHARTSARRRLTDAECRARAQQLIQEYARRSPSAC